jgi:hypothetical protein
MSPRSLLVISAAPDSRPSTATLMALVAELRRRPGLTAHLWFLRAGAGDSMAADRVVDDLRKAQPAAMIAAAGLSRVAGALRGRELRTWWEQASPDAVILDDGLGARVIVDPTVATVVRVNEQLPDDAALEEAPAASADLWVLPEGADRPGDRVIAAPVGLRDFHRVLTHCDPDVRTRERMRLGVAGDLPLVVGWGGDVWLDGVDVFIRCLWTAEHTYGVRASGLWLGLDATADEHARLAAEVRRCGLDGRITLTSSDEVGARLCADAVLLPYRVPDPSPPPLDEIVVTGSQIVASGAAELVGPGITSVSDLDADAAGEALARCLTADRDAVAAELGRLYHVGPLVDDLLASLEEILSHA